MIHSRMMPLSLSGDADLVSESRAGNRDAFGHIVARYQSLVCSMAYSATGSLTQSEDVAQETFIAAWKHLDDLREPPKLRSWLCGITRNLIHNSLRAQRRDPGHGAEPLENIRESESVELPPVERAISEEEAQILWRSLERIPETYRLPLVLFYREHESIESVARHLDLTEDAVRQRLSRGRRLLQEEVRSFVESALDRSGPGKTFTAAVLAALPLGAASAQAATLGAVAVKGGIGGKGILSLGALSGFLGMLGAVVWSWKTAADGAQSPRQRKVIVRSAWFQIPFILICVALGVLTFPQLEAHPVAAGSALAGLLLVIMITSVILPMRLTQRLTAIALEEGVDMRGRPARPGEDLTQQASRKAVRWMLPMLLMLVIGMVYMPWKDHWARSALVVAAEIAVLVWAFLRYRKTLLFGVEVKQPSSPLGGFLRHPLVLAPAILVGSGVLGGVLPFFLYSGPTAPSIPYAYFGRMAWIILLAMAAYAAFIAIGMRWFRSQIGASSKTGGVWNFLSSLGAANPHVIAQQTYAPFFDQATLSADQCSRLKNLIVQRVTAQTTGIMPLMNPKLDPLRRVELVQRLNEASAQAEAAIRDLLGAGDYVRFQDFEKTVLDRTRLNQFSSACETQCCPLRPDQQDQLLERLIKSRREYAWTTALGRRDHPVTDLAAFFNPADIEAFSLEEEEFDRQFLESAQAVLRAEQLAAFAKFQASQRSSQLAQVTMAARMLAG